MIFFVIESDDVMENVEKLEIFILLLKWMEDMDTLKKISLPMDHG